MLCKRLASRRYPFGYTFEDDVRYFKILYRFRGPGLRFNGRALIEGARVAFGKIDSFTSDIV